MRWKWLLVIVPGLLLGLLAICYFMLSRYDFNRFKPEIARLVKAATGRELVIGGDIGLKVDFSPLLTMDDVGLQNASWGSRPEMVRMKRFEVQVALLPLLRDRIEVKRLVLVEPDVLIETDQAGRSNFSLEKPAQVASAPGTSDPGGPARTAAGLRVGEIELQRGKLEYRDGQSGSTFSVAVEQFPFLHHPESERIKILRFAAGGLVVIGPVFPDQAVQKPEAGPRRRGYRRVAGMPVIFGQTG